MKEHSSVHFDPTIRDLIENLVQGVIITNSKGKIEMVNPAFCRVTEYKEDEVIGKNPNILKSGYHDDAFYQDMWKSIMQKNAWEGEVWNRKKSGSLYLEWLAISAVKNKAGELTNFVGIFSDITSRKHTEQRLAYLAHHDPLTGVANRVLFHDRVRQEIARARRRKQKMAFLFVDLDRFKPINDQFGHAIGDLLLRSVAEALKACLRDEDTVARLGGDEFGILLGGNVSKKDIPTITGRIARRFEKPFTILSQELSVGVSMGVSFFPDHGDNVEELMAKADQAMYRAKQRKDRVYYLYSPE